MNLHIISKSPFQHSAFDDALAVVAIDDAILLINDGLYAALTNTATLQKMIATGCTCYALADHALVRGVKLDAHVAAITIQQMVELTLQMHKTISWY